MNILKIVLSLLILAISIYSCSSGPSKEVLEYRRKKAQEIEDNTESFIDMFMTEVWNKPVSLGMSNSGCVDSKANRLCGYRKLSRGLKIKNENNIYKNLKCNKKEDYVSPKLAFGGWSFEKKEIGKQEIDFAFGHKFNVLYNKVTLKNINKERKVVINKICREPKQVSELGALSGFGHRRYKYSKYGVPSTSAWDIQKRLLENGVPLMFCFERKFANSDYYGNRGSSQWVDCVLEKGSYNGEPEGSVSIKTDYGLLEWFKFNNLNFSKSDLKKSFAEIYTKRFQNPEYVKNVSEYYKRSMRIYNAQYKHYMNKIVSEEAYYKKIKERDERRRSKAMADAFSGSLAKGVNNLRNSKIGLADPRIQAAGNTSVSRRAVIPRSSYSKASSYIPVGQPTIAKLNENARNWCIRSGGKFNSSTGVCSNPIKEKCIASGMKWLVDRCDSVINKTKFPGRACYDSTGKQCKTGETISSKNSVQNKRNSRGNVTKCSRNDPSCFPKVVVLCLDNKSKQADCFSFGTKFSNDQWIYTRTGSAGETCAQKFGVSQAEARESWSPNKGFHSFKNHSQNPLASCEKRCREFAKQHNYSCR